MRIEIALCLVLCTAYASCINCTTNADCLANSQSGCSGIGWFEICQHPSTGGVTTGGGLCTCGVSSDCSSLADCAAYSCSNNRNIHCYDGHCICTRF